MNNIILRSKLVLLFAFSLLLFSSCRTESSNSTDTSIAKDIIKTVYTNSLVSPKSLNPVSYSSSYEAPIFHLIFQPLMDVDLESGEILPILVQSKPQIEEIVEGEYKGGIAYTFELKKGITWDNGQEMTAKDIAFSTKLLFAPKVNSPVMPFYLDFLKEVKTYPENPRKITFLTNRKYILGAEALAYIHVLPAYIYDTEKVLEKYTVKDFTNPEKKKELAESNPDLIAFAERFNSPLFQRETLIGSGPYNFVEWETDQKIVLEKKQEWWGNQYKDQNSFFNVNADTIFTRLIKDQNASIISLKNEELDLLTTIDADDFTSLREDDTMKELFNFYTPTTYLFYFLYLNTKSPKLQDKNVRRALAHLVDVEDIIENLYSGFAAPINGPVSPNKDYCNKDLPIIKYDLEKAKQLLAEAGWSDTNNNGTIDKVIDGELTEMILRAPFTNKKFGINLSSYLKEAFKDAGIELETQILEFRAQRQLIGKREFDIASGALSGSNTLDDFTQSYHTSADTPTGLNRSSFGNAETDALIEEITITIDKVKRDSLYKKFQEILYDEQPQIFTFVPLEKIAIHKRLTGTPASIRPYIRAENLGFADKVQQ